MSNSPGASFDELARLYSASAAFAWNAHGFWRGGGRPRLPVFDPLHPEQPGFQDVINVMIQMSSVYRA